MEWIPFEGEFLESDVIRWTEAIWAPNRKKKQKRPWGTQEVTGQITAIDGDFITLKVMKAEIRDNNIAKTLKPHPADAIIKKKRQTLLKGSPQRLLWSDEGARLSLCLGPVKCD